MENLEKQNLSSIEISPTWTNDYNTNSGKGNFILFDYTCQTKLIKKEDSYIVQNSLNSDQLRSLWNTGVLEVPSSCPNYPFVFSEYSWRFTSDIKLTEILRKGTSEAIEELYSIRNKLGNDKKFNPI